MAELLVAARTGERGLSRTISAVPSAAIPDVQCIVLKDDEPATLVVTVSELFVFRPTLIKVETTDGENVTPGELNEDGFRELRNIPHEMKDFFTLPVEPVREPETPHYYQVYWGEEGDLKYGMIAWGTVRDFVRTGHFQPDGDLVRLPQEASFDAELDEEASSYSLNRKGLAEAAMAMVMRERATRHRARWAR